MREEELLKHRNTISIIVAAQIYISWKGIEVTKQLDGFTYTLVNLLLDVPIGTNSCLYIGILQPTSVIQS